MKSLLVIRFSKIVSLQKRGAILYSTSAIMLNGKIPSRYDSFYK